MNRRPFYPQFVETLCCDCGSRPAAVLEACPACGSSRVVRHQELHDLSIAHLDCDAFYAAIEERDRPRLRDRPVIVGGHHRGVVAACCYLARARGVHSAMPMFKALEACPEAAVVRPDMKKYAAVGREVRAMMLSLTPLVEPLSMGVMREIMRPAPAGPDARTCDVVVRTEATGGLGSEPVKDGPKRSAGRRAQCR